MTERQATLEKAGFTFTRPNGGMIHIFHDKSPNKDNRTGMMGSLDMALNHADHVLKFLKIV